MEQKPSFIAYNDYRYIFPPRPKTALPPSELTKYDDGNWRVQAKANGDSMGIFTNGANMILKNRHNEDFSKTIEMKEDLKKVYRGNGKWMILDGEYMIKSQLNGDGKPWNNKFIIWDIIAYDGYQLIGSTFDERVALLDELYGCSETPLEGEYIDKFIYATEHKNIYRMKTFTKDFPALWMEVQKMPGGPTVADKTNRSMYEGFVAKVGDSKLQNGLSVDNNSLEQCKFRRATKNYLF